MTISLDDGWAAGQPHGVTVVVRLADLGPDDEGRHRVVELEELR